MGKDALHTRLIEEAESPIPLLPADEAWASMQAKLDAQLPSSVKWWQRRHIWWYGGAGLFIVAVLLLFLFRSNPSQDLEPQRMILPAGDRPVAVERGLPGATGTDTAFNRTAPASDSSLQPGALSSGSLPGGEAGFWSADSGYMKVEGSNSDSPVTGNSKLEIGNISDRRAAYQQPLLTDAFQDTQRDNLPTASSRPGTANSNNQKDLHQDKSAIQGGDNPDALKEPNNNKAGKNNRGNDPAFTGLPSEESNSRNSRPGKKVGNNNKTEKNNPAIKGNQVRDQQIAGNEPGYGQTDSGWSAPALEATMDSLQRRIDRPLVWTQVLSPVDLTSNPAISDSVNALPDKMGQHLQQAVRPKPSVAWSAGLQLQLQAPLAGTDLLWKGPDGNEQPLNLFVPSAFFSLRYKRHNLSLELQPVTQGVVQNGVFDQYSDTAQVFFNQTLQKTFGWGAAISYRYEIAPHLQAGIGAHMNQWKKGLVLLERFDSGVYKQDYYELPKTDTNWNKVTGTQIKAMAELWYERRRWAVGLRYYMPLQKPVSGLPGLASPSSPAQIGLLFRWKLLPEKRYW